MQRIVCLHDQVLIRPTDPEEVTEGGIVIPGTAREKKSQGTVLAVGPGRKVEEYHEPLERGKVARIPLDVRPEQVVVFSRYAGSEIEVDGEVLLLIGEEHIHAVIEE